MICRSSRTSTFQTTCLLNYNRIKQLFNLIYVSRTTDFGNPDTKEDFEWLIKWVNLLGCCRIIVNLCVRVNTSRGTTSVGPNGQSLFFRDVLWIKMATKDQIQLQLYFNSSCPPYQENKKGVLHGREVRNLCTFNLNCDWEPLMKCFKGNFDNNGSYSSRNHLNTWVTINKTE